jgi:uncharacterized membrane protein YhaH (DUF805 family)
MDFVSAVKSCLSQYVGFAGRASRSEYWWFFLFQVLVMLAASIASDTLYAVASLALLLPGLAAGGRRLHDVGRSGWWQLLYLTGIGALLLLYWFVLPSQD